MATGKAPLRDTISLADLTKLYLYWRDVMIDVLGEEASRLGLEDRVITEALSIVRRGSDGSIVRMAKQFDVERERLQRELAIEQGRLSHQAFHDPLTGLPNRRLLFDRVDHALVVHRRRKSGVGLIFIDIDDFKPVNDRFGHLVGDQLLVATTGRLIEVVRNADTIARFGGDEFTILLEDLNDASSEMVENRAADNLTTLAPSFLIEGRHIVSAASVGANAREPGRLPRTTLFGVPIEPCMPRRRRERTFPPRVKQRSPATVRHERTRFAGTIATCKRRRSPLISCVCGG